MGRLRALPPAHPFRPALSIPEGAVIAAAIRFLCHSSQHMDEVAGFYISVTILMKMQNVLPMIVIFGLRFLTRPMLNEDKLARLAYIFK